MMRREGAIPLCSNMGLFSSKTKHVYSCYATPLYEGMPPLVKQTVAAAVINNRNIGSDITANIINGVLFKANQFYSYAQRGSYHWGLPNSNMVYMNGTSKDACQAVLEFIEKGPVYITSVIIEPDGSGDYVYTVNYYLVDSTGNTVGEVKEWVYNEGLGTYPTLTLDTVEAVSPYYPIIPIRLDNINLAESDSTYGHKQDILKACRFLDVDVKSIYEDINSQDTDNPPEDMYILMGASIGNDTPRTNEYLYRYFEHMYHSSAVTKTEYDYWGEVESETTQAPANTVVIADSQFHAEISWSYITTEVLNQSGKKGAYSIEYVQNAGRVEHEDWIESTDGIRITWQKTATQAISYLVHGLVYRSKVAGDNWVSKDCMNAFGDPDDPENGEVFIIPLRKDICKEMGSIKSHDLFYEAIRLHVNDEYSYKVKWYQTGFGQIFTLVVAIAISVVFQQWQAGAAIMTAATAGLVIQNVIIALLLKPVFTVLVQDVFGEELALLVTAIVTVFAFNIGMTSTGSIGVTSATPTISSVANASLNLYTGIKSLDIQAEMDSLIAEQEELGQLIKEQHEDEMQSALDTKMVTNMISNDPFALMQASTYVQRSRWEIEKPLLLKQATTQYTKVAQFTDIPDSMIRLDVY